MNGYVSIKQAANEGILPEYRLRMRLKQKQLPGVYCGTKFMINREALIEMLQAESLANIGGSAKDN